MNYVSYIVGVGYEAFETGALDVPANIQNSSCIAFERFAKGGGFIVIFQYRILFFNLISFVMGLEITLKVVAGITILTFMEKTSFKSFYINKIVFTDSLV